MRYFEINAVTGNITAEYAIAQRGEPSIIPLPESDGRVIAWRNLAAWNKHRGEASAALLASNSILLQILENQILSPGGAPATDQQTYVNYRQALRSIVEADTGDPATTPIPAEPPLPAGTVRASRRP